MSAARRLLVVALVALVGGVMALARPAPAEAQTAYPARYPETYPSTGALPYPATYPSTDTLPYPETSPARYPSTADRPSGPAGLPGIAAAVPEGAGPVAGPAIMSPMAAPPPIGAGDPLYAPYASPEATAAGRPLQPGDGVDQWLTSDQPWTWQALPTGLMYKSYLAGGREPRFGTQFIHERNQGWLWDTTLGARVGLVRYGTENDLWPEGWQLDVEGAAFPRLMLEHDRDLNSVDFRAGLPLTHRVGPWEMKFGYYHYCAHMGDEFVLTHPEVIRINYVRETIIFGMAFYPSPDLRLYAEAGWAFQVEGESLPWEFQFGADWSSPEPTGPGGAPFFAINGHLRQENEFGGNLTVETGWQWRGATGHLFRIGMRYFNGMSEQCQFYNIFEEQIGVGLWYDF